MKIGNLEIKWPIPEPDKQFVGLGRSFTDAEAKLLLYKNTTAVFAVSEDEPWWIAVHLLLDELEKEMVIGARNQVANTNVCISAVGAGEGVAMVRQRLIETRKIALRKPAA